MSLLSVNSLNTTETNDELPSIKRAIISINIEKKDNSHEKRLYNFDVNQNVNIGILKRIISLAVGLDKDSIRLIYNKKEYKDEINISKISSENNILEFDCEGKINSEEYNINSKLENQIKNLNKNLQINKKEDSISYYNSSTKSSISSQIFEFDEYKKNLESIKCFKTIKGSYFDSIQSLALYKIKRNNKIHYEMAYANYFTKDLVIYDLVSENVKCTLENAHNKEILKVKYYYYEKKDMPLLLTSSTDCSFRIFSLSLLPPVPLLILENAHDGKWVNPCCLFSGVGSLFLIGGSHSERISIWDLHGKRLGIIHQSRLEGVLFLETEYIDGGWNNERDNDNDSEKEIYRKIGEEDKNKDSNICINKNIDKKTKICTNNDRDKNNEYEVNIIKENDIEKYDYDKCNSISNNSDKNILQKKNFYLNGYIILSGLDHVEVLNFKTGEIKSFKDTNCEDTWHCCATLKKLKGKYYLFDSDHEGLLRLFNFSTGEIWKIINLKGQENYALCLYNNKYLICGGEDKSLKIVDIEKDKIIKEYNEHSDIVYNIFKYKYKKNEYIITSSKDGSIKLWK